MEVHQTAFVQAVALAGIVALAMTGWDKSREDGQAQASGTRVRTAVTQGVQKSYVALASHKGEVQP